MAVIRIANAGGYWGDDPDAPRGTQTLRIKVIDGRVVGETIRRSPEGEEIVQRWEYLKITPQGMSWGNMNGMRPHGLNLFEGRLEGDVLKGTVRFGGIDFRLPDGSAPRPLYFEFTRVRK